MAGGCQAPVRLSSGRDIGRNRIRAVRFWSLFCFFRVICSDILPSGFDGRALAL